jgi:cysteine desulfurase
MYGPKGVGALYVRRRRPASGSSRSRRAAARNAACARARSTSRHRRHRQGVRDRRGDGQRRRERLLQAAQQAREGLTEKLDDVQVNGHAEKRAAAHHQHLLRLRRGRVADDGMQGHRDELGLGLHQRQPRAQLRAQGLGVGDELAHSSLRLSLGRFSTEEEVDFAIEVRSSPRQEAPRTQPRSTTCTTKASTSPRSSGRRTEPRDSTEQHAARHTRRKDPRRKAPARHDSISIRK